MRSVLEEFLRTEVSNVRSVTRHRGTCRCLNLEKLSRNEKNFAGVRDKRLPVEVPAVSEK